MGKQQIEDLNKEAYKQAEEELKAEKVALVKDFVLKTLRKIDETKKSKELIEEQLRILNKDLEDLRNGDFSKIEERINKSAVAKGISQVFLNEINNLVHTVNTVGYSNSGSNYSGSLTTTASGPMMIASGSGLFTKAEWNDLTSGTYPTSSKTYYL